MLNLTRLLHGWIGAAERPPQCEAPALAGPTVTRDPVLACERIREMADETIARLFEPDLAGWRLAHARQQFLPLLQTIRAQAMAVAPYAGEPRK